MSVVCVDAGTSMVKAVRFDDDGTPAAVARRQTSVHRPAPGHSEQDMDAVWAAVGEVIQGVADPGVRFVAITGQGDGCWLVDDAGEPTGPAVLWNDARATAIVDEWTRSGMLERGFELNGSIGFAGLPHAILTWMQREDPERLERSALSLTCNGFLFNRMTGTPVADTSDAAVPFLDIRSGRYSTALIELYDMPWVERLLPRVVDDGERVQPLRVEVADRWGLPAGTPVVLTPYDIVATAMGVGAVDSGYACGILGTTICVEVVTDVIDTDGPPAGLTIPFGVPDTYVRAFPTLAGTEVIEWALTMLGLDRAEDLSQLAASAAPGAEGLMLLPYLSPAGERAPFLDTSARGSIHGLSFEHDRTHLARAVLEGLTMVIRDCMDASPTGPSRLGVSGGGARSDVWCQLIADVTGVSVQRTSDEEVGARGAHLYGLMATGEADNLRSAAERHVRLTDTFEPDPDRHSLYTTLWEVYRELRDSELNGAWPHLKGFREAGRTDG